LINFSAIDGFLDDFDSFRNHCDSVDYCGEVNELDGVFYPNVSTDIPDQTRQEVIDKVAHAMGVDISPGAMFLRLSEQGVDAPHQAHTDSIMGQYGMMLYVNRLEDCIGGTSFVIHKDSGLIENPINEIQEFIWKRDTNVSDAWQIMDICPMITNRAMIFKADRMHRAEPVGGFGEGAKRGRLVLTFFFNVND